MFTVIRKYISTVLSLAAAASAAAGGDGKADAGLRGEWESFDGARFPYTKWLPAGGAKAKAVVVCVHGLSGAASDFEQLGGKLARRGVAVYAYELRGQGNDPEEKRIGDIRRREHWFADLDRFTAFARGGHPGAPVFLYGESLGSLILMHGFAALDADNREAVKGVMFASPVIALPGKLPPVKNFFVHLAIKICPCLKVSLLDLAGDTDAQVTGDGDHWEQMEKTPHFVRRFTLRMLGTVEDMVEGCGEVAARLRVPVLVLYPGKDLFTTPEQVEAFYEELGSPDKTKQLFAESHHLLHYGGEREKVFKRIREWVEERS